MRHRDVDYKVVSGKAARALLIFVIPLLRPAAAPYVSA